MTYTSLLEIIKEYKKGQIETFFEAFSKLDIKQYEEISVFGYDFVSEEYNHFASFDKNRTLLEFVYMLEQIQLDHGGSWRLDLSSPTNDVWHWVEIGETFFEWDIA